jgi:hypothetical protein
MNGAPGTTGTRQLRRWPWTVLALATALVVVGPLAAHVYRKTDVHVQAAASVYHHPITTLQVTSDGSGSFTVRAGPAGQVRITSSRTWSGAVRPIIRPAWHGRTLEISVSCAWGTGWQLVRMLGSSCGIGVDVQVPRDVSGMGSREHWLHQGARDHRRSPSGAAAPARRPENF